MKTKKRDLHSEMQKMIAPLQLETVFWGQSGEREAHGPLITAQKRRASSVVSSRAGEAPARSAWPDKEITASYVREKTGKIRGLRKVGPGTI